MPSSAGVSGAVLTGGAGRRMGADKALIEIEARPLAARVVDALERTGADPVTCVGGDLGALRAAGLSVLADLHPGEGPLGGVLTALEHPGAAEVVVVLAADLLSPEPTAIAEVVAALVADPTADLAVPVVDGRAQWLHAAWRRRAAPAIRRRFDGGERSVHRAVAGVPMVHVGTIPAAAVEDADLPGDLPTPPGRAELP